MYQVKLYEDHTDDAGTVIHSPYNINNIKLSSGQINHILGSIHDFNFNINIKNPAWNKIKPYKTLIEVKDVFRNKVVFEGRTLQPKSKMTNSGMFTRSVVCESVLSYLLDSSQRHAEIHDTTVKEFLQIIIDNHNAQVEEHKRFKLGHVTVTNTTDNVYRYLGYENSYETIKEKLVKRLDGYLIARRESDGLYIDYLEEAGKYIPSTPIKIAHNMQTIDYEVDPTEVITRLVPLGERIESEDEDATDASQARLTIEDVNDGKDYIDDDDLIAEFGIIEKSITWDDVTQPSRLLTNGRNYLRDQKAAIARFNVDSTNSYLLGKDIASFELGNYHDLINPIVNVNEKVQIIEKKIDINQPQKSSLKIGDKFRTLTDYQKGMRETKKEVTELKGRVEGLSSKYNQSRQELENAKTQLSEVQNTLEHINAGEIPEELANLHRLLNEVQDSIDNIEIPVYGLVTPSNDGLMSRYDKVKLDSLSDTNYDSEINEINTKINGLIDRVEALEE